jgi:UDP-GlcNAc:undecaprenyl-phosphate/decaprenyl-phosphate GlcNAc-1-phosphate transferase
VGAVSASCLLVVALMQGDQTIAVMLVALLGSLLGFLKFNWHPARIYMGDTGAMFIGLLLGAMTMIERYPGDHPLSLLTPVFIVGIPIFDTLFVMYVRYRRGLPIFWGSPDHAAIRLRQWGLSVPQIVIMSYVATAVVGMIGIAMLSVSQEVGGVLCAGTVGALVVVTMLLKKVDTHRHGQADVALSQREGKKAA